MKLMIKAFLSGFVSVLMALAVLYIIGIVGILYKSRGVEEEGVGWDPVAALTLPGFLVFVILMFFLGFLGFLYRHRLSN